jgi:hypothetical protein
MSCAADIRRQVMVAAADRILFSTSLIVREVFVILPDVGNIN